MRADIEAIMAANNGLLTRRQALSAGLSDDEVRQLLRGGELEPVRVGVYAAAGTLTAQRYLSDRQRLLDRAACAHITVPFVRSHTTSALELGMPILLPPKPMTHVSRPRIVGTNKDFGVKHHLAPYAIRDVIQAHGFHVLDHARTAVDIAREYGDPYGLVAVDQARQAGVSLARFDEVLTPMKFWPNRRRADEAVDESDPGAESVGETLSRRLLKEIGLTRIETQFGLTDGFRRAWFDLRVGRHVIEFDGRGKYLRTDVTDLDVVGTQGRILDEKDREDWARGFHLGMSRLTWADVWGPGREAAKVRLLREIGATNRLWGTSIDDLERFRIRGRRQAS